MQKGKRKGGRGKRKQHSFHQGKRGPFRTLIPSLERTPNGWPALRPQLHLSVGRKGKRRKDTRGLPTTCTPLPSPEAHVPSQFSKRELPSCTMAGGKKGESPLRPSSAIRNGDCVCVFWRGKRREKGTRSPSGPTAAVFPTLERSAGQALTLVCYKGKRKD